MFSNSKPRLIRVLTHLLVWSLMAFVLFMYPPMASKEVKLPENFVIKQTVHLFLMVSAYYLNTYFLIPQLLLKNKKLLFLACIVGAVVLFSFTLAVVDGWLRISQQLEPILGRKMWKNPYIDFFGLLTTVFVLGISTSIAVVQKWDHDNNLRKDFETQRVVAELSFLKAQIHPHFFFNTLNSIYALTFINVERSRKVLYKLSRMMRYLLYETQQNKVPLANELAFIQDYVEVMKLRTKENMTIEFTMPTETEGRNIAPMLLLPYIENAFKHGVDDVRKAVIAINIRIIPNGIELKVRNLMVSHLGEGYGEDERTGIGMVNARRRLDLLYKEKYSLDYGEDIATNEYHLHLTLDLG